MRSLTWIFCFFYTVSVSFSAVPLEAQIDQAISHLGHPDFLVRQKAFKTLEKDIFSKRYARKLLKERIINGWNSTLSPDIKNSLEKLYEFFVPYTWEELIAKMVEAFSKRELVPALISIQKKILSSIADEDFEQIQKLNDSFRGFDKRFEFFRREGIEINSEQFKNILEAHKITAAKWLSVHHKILANFKVLSSAPIIWTLHIPEKIYLEHGTKSIIEENGFKYRVCSQGNEYFSVEFVEAVSFNFDEILKESARDLPHQVSHDRFKEIKVEAMLRSTFETESFDLGVRLVGSDAQSMPGLAATYLRNTFPEYQEEITQGLTLYYQSSAHPPNQKPIQKPIPKKALDS